MTTMIGAMIPASWPPEHFDEAAVRFTLDWLRRAPRDVQWGFYYIELPGTNGATGTLIGAGGFKGAPDSDGIVEIGYSVLPDFQRKGYAFEAVDGWIGQAVLRRELEEINSLLCGPCRCNLCCVGPEADMRQSFFEIPLSPAEIETRY